MACVPPPHWTDRPWRAALAVLLVAGMAAPAWTPAWADVFEVGSDGGFTRTGGGDAAMPAVATGDGQGLVTADGDPGDELAEAEPRVLLEQPFVPAAAVTLVGAPAMPAGFAPAVLAAAQRYQVSPDLLAALVWQESRWQPAALSPKGALGLGQLMPATARALAVDPRNAADNLAGAAHYLRRMLDLFDGDVERALAAYNAGPERVLKAGGVPRIAETQAYVSGIMARLAATRAGVAGVQP